MSNQNTPAMTTTKLFTVRLYNAAKGIVGTLSVAATKEDEAIKKGIAYGKANFGSANPVEGKVLKKVTTLEYVS